MFQAVTETACLGVPVVAGLGLESVERELAEKATTGETVEAPKTLSVAAAVVVLAPLEVSHLHPLERAVATVLNRI